MYHTRAISTGIWFETALVYKPRILGLKNEEFLFLVHKWSVIWTAVKIKNELKKIQTVGYNGAYGNWF